MLYMGRTHAWAWAMLFYMETKLEPTQYKRLVRDAGGSKGMGHHYSLAPVLHAA